MTSIIYDYMDHWSEYQDGTQRRLVNMEDRVPIGYYAVVRDPGTNDLTTLAQSAKALGLKGLIFVVGDSTDQNTKWSPNPLGEYWQQNQHLISSNLPAVAPYNGGPIFGAQPMRSEKLVIGGMFILGRGTKRSPSGDSYTMASIVNRLQLDFICLDMDNDVWKERGSSEITLNIHSQVLDGLKRPPLAPLQPRISQYRPIFSVLPESTSEYDKLLSNEGDRTFEVFQRGATAPMCFAMPRVPADKSATTAIDEAWQWAAFPPSNSQSIGRCEIMIDIRDGHSPDAIAQQAFSRRSVPISGSTMPWNVHSGVVVLDDYLSLKARGALPPHMPTSYWDYDGLPVMGSYVTSIYPHPTMPAVVRSEYAAPVDQNGIVYDPTADISDDIISVSIPVTVMFENWKTGHLDKRPLYVEVVTDVPTEGNFISSRSLRQSWILFNNIPPDSNPHTIRCYGSGSFTISGKPVLGDEGWYPVLMKIYEWTGINEYPSRFAGEASLMIPVLGLEDVNEELNANPYNQEDDLVPVPRGYMPRLPYEWGPPAEWTQEFGVQSISLTLETEERGPYPSIVTMPPGGADGALEAEAFITGMPTFNQAPTSIRKAIARNFPRSEWENAARISQCESGWNTHARATVTQPLPGNSPEDSLGLFQINILAHTQYASNPEALFDPDNNAAAAYLIWRLVGWNSTAGWKNCSQKLGIFSGAPPPETFTSAILSCPIKRPYTITAGCNGGNHNGQGINAIDMAPPNGAVTTTYTISESVNIIRGTFTSNDERVISLILSFWQGTQVINGVSVPLLSTGIGFDGLDNPQSLTGEAARRSGYPILISPNGSTSIWNPLPFPIPPGHVRWQPEKTISYISNLGEFRPVDHPIYASADGTVLKVGWQDANNKNSGLGVYVEQSVDSTPKMTVRYAHMSEHESLISPNTVRVREGQRVRRGDILGYVGSTGKSSGPHVHLEVLLNGVTDCPNKYLPAACLEDSPTTSSSPSYPDESF